MEGTGICVLPVDELDEALQLCQFIGFALGRDGLSFTNKGFGISVQFDRPKRAKPYQDIVYYRVMARGWLAERGWVWHEYPSVLVKRYV